MKTQQYVMIAAVAAGLVCATGANAATFTLQPRTPAAGGDAAWVSANGAVHDSFVGGDTAAGAGAVNGQIESIGGATYNSGYGSWGAYLVQFDKINPSSFTNVTSATFNMEFYFPSLDGPTGQISLYQVTSSWASGVTAAAGGTSPVTFNLTPLASQSFSAAPGSATATVISWSSAALTTLVNGWAAGTTANDGLLVQWDPTVPTGPQFDFSQGRDWNFYGSGNLPGANSASADGGAPSLVFDATAVTAVPEPSTILLTVGGVLFVLRRWKQ